MRPLRFSSTTRARRRRAGRRTAAAIVMAGVVGAGLSGCSTAPTAATVNGAHISEPQLAATLQTFASDPGYTQEQDAQLAEAALQLAQQTGQQGPAFKVAPFPGFGQDAPGEYGTVWVDVVLSNLIAEQALRQYLQRKHLVPTRSEVAAAWAAEYASAPARWRGLSPGARADAALYDAQRSLIEGPALMAPARNLYHAHPAYFWSQLCLAEVDVPAGPGGLPAARRQAQTVAQQLSGKTVSGAPPVLGASLYCDTPEELLGQPVAFQDQVAKLAPGQAAVLPAAYGFQVVEVRSRSTVPIDQHTAGAIDIVADLGGAMTLAEGDTELAAVLRRAHVEVNPRFGSWSANLPAPCPPAVVSVAGQGTCYP